MIGLEKNYADTQINDLINTMERVATLSHIIGTEHGDINMVLKGNILGVLSNILKEDELYDFNDLLKYYSSKKIVDALSNNELVGLFRDETSEDFKVKVSAFDAFKKDFDELGEEGFKKFKDDFNKDNPNFGLDNLLNMLGKE